jgi:hypothetical protein
MSYHSNNFLTNIVLRINEAIPDRTPKLPKVEQVRRGALTDATPSERAHFFAFARDVMGLPACGIFLIGAISMFFGVKGELNIVLFVFTVLAAILFVLTLKFKKRQEACQNDDISIPPNLDVLSTRNFISAIPIGTILGFMVYLFLFFRYNQS